MLLGSDNIIDSARKDEDIFFGVLCHVIHDYSDALEAPP